LTGPRGSRQPKHRRSCHDRALGLLAVRPRSRRELELRLLRAGFDRDEVAQELERLSAVGLVDDRRFAESFAEHAVGTKLAGRRAVVAALSARGVDRATIERTLAQVPGGEADRAVELARLRATRLTGLPPEVAARRLVGFLARRGYEAGVARRAAAAALGLEGDGSG
jgi:regulatory protein